MNGPEQTTGVDLPTFSECVIGYRLWRADRRDQLWPIRAARRPWAPGINTARCNCRDPTSLRFEWSLFEGRRVLEPAPKHPAPEGACACGLYSWRRPSPRWRADSGLVSFPHVVGAVASWGRLQVHDAGFRAEHACVVTLAYGPETQPDALAVLERIARRYRVDLVPLDELERAASRHGTPLPDDLRPPPVPAADDVADAGMLTPSSGHEVAAGVGIADEVGFVHAPDATPDEVPPAKRDPRLEPKTLLPPGFGYPGVG